MPKPDRPKEKTPAASTAEVLDAKTPNSEIERTKPMNSIAQRAHMPALVLGGFTVRQLDGLYCLNDLHRAAGGHKRHQPSDFLKIDQTQALLTELGNSEDSRSLDSATGQETAGIPAVFTIQGRNGGTYACRELVVAYAAWISAAFHLQVIRVFLATARPDVMKARTVRDRQIGRCQALLRDIERSDSKFCRDGLISLASAAFTDLGLPMPAITGLRPLQLPLVPEGGAA